MNAVVVPFDQLSKQALFKLVEEFVTRDGTDYGKEEVPLHTKIDQVMAQLRQKKAVLIFDLETDTANILPADSRAVRELEK